MTFDYFTVVTSDFYNSFKNRDTNMLMHTNDTNKNRIRIISIIRILASIYVVFL